MKSSTLFVCAVATLIVAAGAAQAQTCSWTGNTPGPFSTTCSAAVGSSTSSAPLTVVGSATGGWSTFQRGNKVTYVNPDWSGIGRFGFLGMRGTDGNGLSLSPDDNHPGFLAMSNSGHVGIGIADLDITDTTPGFVPKWPAALVETQLSDSNTTFVGSINQIGIDLINRNAPTNGWSTLAFSRFPGGSGLISAAIGAQFTNPANFAADLAFGTGSAISGPNGPANGVPERMRLTSAGNLGLGTSAPDQSAAFTVRKYALGANNKHVSASFSDATSSSTLDIRHPATNIVDLAAENSALTFSTMTSGSDLERMRIATDGTVTVYGMLNGGTVTATSLSSGPLNVTGNVTVTSGNLNVVNGDITGVRVFNAVYQDIAEWVPASDRFAPGTVVVLDPSATNRVTASAKAYDTMVAGVVSEQPGMLLGKPSPEKAPVATLGRVRVRVDATKHAVHVGDLLVTSDKPGMAMVSEPVEIGGVRIHRPGTLIGKALEPLPSGTGAVLVLLSLQ